jgi:hypothetical protein
MDAFTHSCVLLNSNSLECSGNNGDGQLGLGNDKGSCYEELVPATLGGQQSGQLCASAGEGTYQRGHAIWPHLYDQLHVCQDCFTARAVLG